MNIFLMKEMQYLIIILLKLWLNSVICICSNLEASIGYCLKISGQTKDYEIGICCLPAKRANIKE